MNALDSLRRMVASYPGGRAAIAARLSKSEEVLRKELSGCSSGHKMGLADAELIAEMCHEAGTADAAALATVFSFNAGMLTLPVVESSKALCLAGSTAAAVHESAEVLLAVTKGAADGNISDNDKKAIQKEIGEAVAALQAVARALKQKHAADAAGGAAI